MRALRLHLRATVTSAEMRRRAYRMSEDEFQEKIRRLCRRLGLTVQHFPDARRCWQPGHPDLEIWGRSLLCAELKRQDPRAQPSPDQRRMARIIRQAGIPWRLWRPLDLLTGDVAAELVAISPLPVVAFTAEDIDRIIA